MLKKVFIIITLCFGVISKAQSKSNLELFETLIQYSVNDLDTVLIFPNKIFLEVTVPNSYDILKGKIIHSFYQRFNIVDKENSNYKVNYYLNLAKVTYNEPTKEGLFSDFKVKRQIEINGNALVENNFGKISSFEIKKTFTDTIYIDDISSIENNTLPFTQSQIPSVPFFSNFFEPIIVVGTLVVSTVLLFVVRSK